MSQFAQWQSPLDLEAIFSRQGPPAYPFYNLGGQLFWLESLTAYKGRLAIVAKVGEETKPLTPKDFQVRTAVHEYGGQAFCYHNEAIVFNNYNDGRLYTQSLPVEDEKVSAPKPLSECTANQVGFADLSVNHTKNWLVAVQEQVAEPENTNCITLINLDAELPKQPQCLASGADFYSCPSISPDGSKLAWVQWNHPNMPWDESAACMADLVAIEGQVQLTNQRLIDGGKEISICQLAFLRDGSLVYAKDQQTTNDGAANYWNLYRWRDDAVSTLTADLAEYGDAHWVFGQTRWVQIDNDSLLAIRTRQGQDELVHISMANKAVTKIADEFARLSQINISPSGAKVCVVAQYTDQESKVLEFSLKGGKVSAGESRYAIAPMLSPEWVSVPQVVTFKTSDGEHAYANFYQPKHTGYSEKQGAAACAVAPAIVMVHGGPTSRADQSLSLLVQFFTTSGFAVIDVNHRGSTGLGRQYRQKLLGSWGEVDAADIKDAVKHFVDAGLVHPEKICIRGGSAGGYAILRALTRYPNLFSAGACYYGIGNLITLSAITHKFESRYTDQLVGEKFDPATAALLNSRFTQRSPIFEMDKIKSPVILFQGLDDKVVPPAVSREVVNVLQQGGVQHEYIEYQGEGHGFRQAQTRVDALSKEMAFYRRILGGVADVV